MKKLILHIPHASEKIPFYEGFVLPKERITKEVLKLTDWHTDDLFDAANCEKIVADFSRVFCDPERFPDDAQEPMAKVGMGVLYTKTDDDELMRVATPTLREKIMKQHYSKHHSKLKNAVKTQLQAHNKALILDCHSFPSTPIQKSQDKRLSRPDFNIGTDNFHTPQNLIDKSVAFFKERNLSLGVDYPFKGSIVPLEYYQKNKNVASIMLEVNRKLYLKEGTDEKSANYQKTKAIVQAYIDLVKTEL